MAYRQIRKACAVAIACIAASVNAEAQTTNSGANGSEAGIVDAGRGAGIPSTVLLAGLNVAPANATTYLRFTNTSAATGQISVAIYAAATGAQIATWTSPTVPPLASLQITTSAIAAAASPAVTANQAASNVNFGISAAVDGDIQLVAIEGGTLVNLTDCGFTSRQTVIGNVAGPGNSTFTDAIRIVNPSTQAGNALLTLIDGSTGSTVGSWTSPAVPANGSVTVAISTIASGATPAVRPAVGLLTVLAQPIGGVRIEHVSEPKVGTGFADLTPACKLRGSGTGQLTGTPNAGTTASASAGVNGIRSPTLTQPLPPLTSGSR